MPLRPTITVALVEDEPAIQERLTRAIGQAPELALAHVADRAAPMLDWLRTHPVDVLLVDLGLPDMSGLEVVAQCRRLQPHCQVMVVTMFTDDAHVVSAFEAGASGYIVKDGAEADIAVHIGQLHAGGSPLSPMIARQILRRWQHPKPPQAVGVTPASPAPPREELTAREGEVLGLVARGFTYVEAAARMGVSPSTVRTHVRNVYSKLDVHNKTEAVFEARHMGLLP